jgi:hypothetical protein
MYFLKKIDFFLLNFDNKYMSKNIKEITKDSVLNFEFNRFSSYFLITEEDLYKLQCVNNAYAQDPDKIEYAFCPFSNTCTYFGGYIGDPNKFFKNILKLDQGRLFESSSARGLDNLYLLLIKMNKMIDDLDVLDRIKYDESYKKMYDVGYIKALLIYLKQNNPTSVWLK